MTVPGAYRGKIAVRREGESSFSYYECVDDHDRCPTCNYRIHSYGSDTCYPEKRLVVSGALWWKKGCPLGGVHVHRSCRNCNTVWVCFHVDRQPSAKVHV